MGSKDDFLIKQSDLLEEVVLLYALNNIKPKTSNRDSSIINLSYNHEYLRRPSSECYTKDEGLQLLAERINIESDSKSNLEERWETYYDLWDKHYERIRSEVYYS